jgi:hypothetical protein
MDFNLSCNLLNFVFEASNIIHVKFCIICEFEKKIGASILGAPVWEPGPNFERGSVGAPKMTQPVAWPAKNLGASVEMLSGMELPHKVWVS